MSPELLENIVKFGGLGLGVVGMFLIEGRLKKRGASALKAFLIAFGCLLLWALTLGVIIGVVM